ncbi:MAG: phosphoribosyltransferase [Candidatus Sungiibacteriota bacterium]|uniref:Phosphoribosyltransferase n=1 Tax=Candidatus Sungiibacteriota bacterium TaxID=2750080 RepID=A0A7T5RKV9_9BACT|nr:MAG: phosphoribosyltransferase [Candidatus Sungbacteria bacterium]
MKPTINYSWKQFDSDVKKIAKLLRARKKVFNGVWGPIRGGLPLAVCLSHALGIPFLQKPNGKKTLIVDDIADTGKTLKKFADKNYFIVTLFYRRGSVFKPNIWLREKKDKWVKFPWEKK